MVEQKGVFLLGHDWRSRAHQSGAPERWQEDLPKARLTPRPAARRAPGSGGSAAPSTPCPRSAPEPRRRRRRRRQAARCARCAGAGCGRQHLRARRRSSPAGCRRRPPRQPLSRWSQADEDGPQVRDCHVASTGSAFSAIGVSSSCSTARQRPRRRRRGRRGAAFPAAAAAAAAAAPSAGRPASRQLLEPRW